MADFNRYTLEDFIDNPGFVSWVLGQDSEADIYWNQVKLDFPEKAALMAEASRLILSLRFENHLMSAAEQTGLWTLIAAQTIQQHKIKKPVRIIPLWLRTAAAMLLIGLGLGIAILFFNRSVTVSTDYGQLSTLVLPDSSVVTLNAHSQLHYARNWNKEQVREVWISGEALFKVNHLHRSGQVLPCERFIVHAGRVDIEVLGTTFNVKDRHEKVDVGLITGKVSFNVLDKKGPGLVMQPGEELQYNRQQDTIIKMTGNAALFAAWKNGELHFDHTPVSEVFQFLEDIYGYKVVVENPDILKKTLSGTFISTKEDNLLKTIATALGITIRKSGTSKELIVQYDQTRP